MRKYPTEGANSHKRSGQPDQMSGTYCTTDTPSGESSHHMRCTEGANLLQAQQANLSGTKDRGSGNLDDESGCQLSGAVRIRRSSASNLRST